MVESAHMELSIRCFGAFDVRIGGEPLRKLRSKKGSLLLAYLVLHPDQELERWDIISALWPQTDREMGGSEAEERERTEKALATLNRTLTDLRAALGPVAGRLCSVTSHTLRLTLAETEADVVAFDQAVLRGDSVAQEQILSLHTRSLLTGWGKKEGEEWILRERENRQQHYCQALEGRFREAVSRGKYDSALADLVRLADLKRVEEENWLALMQALFDQGNFRQAHSVSLQLLEYLSRLSMPPPGAAFRVLCEAIPILERNASPQAKAKPSAVHLPCSLTQFLGRESELAAIRREITKPPPLLLTLVGAGGMGKSRIALEAGHRLAAFFTRNVWLVSLANVTEPSLLFAAIARELQLEVPREQQPLPVLLAFLKSRNSSLLILDNYEQLAERGVHLLQVLLHQAPFLKILVTSRIALGIPGERLVMVTPLPVPPSSRELEELKRSPSMQMLVNRIQGVQAGFVIREDNAQTLAEICRRLEGIPLALELVAAWGRVLTPAAILARLDKRFALLEQDHPPPHARHRSLRVALAASYELLSPTLQDLFQRLSLFRNGFTAEAVAAVCASSAAIESLSLLGMHSFLIGEDIEGAMRFSMLETLREFGQEMLGEVERQETCGRLVAYYDVKLLEAEPHITVHADIAWLNWFDLEYANLEIALDWELRNASEPCLLRRPALHTYWHRRRPLADICDWMRGFIDPPDPDMHPFMQAKVLVNLGGLSVSSGDFDRAPGYLEEGLKYFRAKGHEHDELGCLTNLGYLTLHQADYSGALTYAKEALRLAEKLKLREMQALQWKGMGHAHMHLGAHEDAHAAFLKARAIYRELEDPPHVLSIDFDIGTGIFLSGDHARALTHWRQGLSQARLQESLLSIASHLLALGRAHLRLGDYSAAKDHFRQALKAFQSLQDLMGIPHVVAAFSELRLAEGWIRAAGYCAGIAENLWQQAGHLDASSSLLLFSTRPDDPVYTAALQAGRNATVMPQTIDLDALPTFQEG